MADWSPVLIGDEILKNYDIITSIETGIIYIYKKGFYNADNVERKLRRIIRKELNNHYSNHKVNEVIHYIKDTTCTNLSTPIEESYISLENCNLNIDTLDVESHTASRYLTNQIPVIHNPDADATDWEKYVNSLVSEKEFTCTIQEFCGYVFVKHQKAKKVIFIYGPEDSGKSTFLNILRAFYGNKNCSSLSLHQLCEKYTNAELFGKITNIRSDMDYKIPPISVNLIKSLTGDDVLSVQKKFKDPFSFHNRAKIFLSANGIPALPSHGVDNAFYKRWIPIEFPHIFKGENKDFLIFEKFTTPEAKSAILNWMLKGLIRLRENNWRFTYSLTVKEIKNWFESGIIPNDVEEYLLENFVPYHSKWIEKETLYNHYMNLIRAKGIPLLERNAFHRKVKHNRFFPVTEFKPTINRKQVYAWKGIGFK